MNKNNPSDLKSSLNQLESTLDLYFRQKAPALPANIKELIVNFAPWLALIAIVLSLPTLLLALGIGTFVMPFSYLGGYHTGLVYTLSLFVLAASLILMAIALPSLFKKSLQGWKFMFYSTLISAVYNLISFNLGGFIIGTLISFYILFQVREYYK